MEAILRKFKKTFVELMKSVMLSIRNYNVDYIYKPILDNRTYLFILLLILSAWEVV